MKCWLAVAAALAAVALVCLTASGQSRSEWYVDSDSDAGPGTLRWAIEQANESGGDDLIRFNAAMTIRPRFALPELADEGITIDASGGEASADVEPRVWLDGSLAGDAAGLELVADRGVVRGLGIGGFQRYGIGVIGAAATAAEIRGNWIGLTSGGGASANRLSGVAVIGGARGARIVGNRIGGNSVAARTGHGIVVGGAGSVGTEIADNVIGMRGDGAAAPNDDGILIVDSAQATILDNTIGHSAVAGIELRETRQAIAVGRNRVGLRRDGVPAPNDVGVFLGPGSALARIGSHGGNVIAGNRVGIAVEQGAREALIERNWVGLAPSDGSVRLAEDALPQARVLPNRERGISVIAGATAVRLQSNYVAAGDFGIVIDSATTARVSLIRNVVAGSRQGRTEAAIDVRSGAEISIGGDSGYGNHVCGAEFGIRLANTWEASVRGNAVGAGAATRVRFDSEASMRWGIRLDSGVVRARVEENEIAEIERAAISVVGASSQDNSLLGNHFGRSGIEIDLGADGATVNDRGDADQGPNGLLNHPEIQDHEARRISANQIRSTIRGSASPGSYVQIYVRTISGERVLVKRSDRADAAGRWEAATLELPQGELRALAFTPAGATSEFSPAFAPSRRVVLSEGLNWFAWTGPAMEIERAMASIEPWLMTVWVWVASDGGWRGWSPLPAGNRAGLERLAPGNVVRLQVSTGAPRDFFLPAGGRVSEPAMLDLKRGYNSATWLDRDVDSLESLAELAAEQPGLIGSVWQWDGDSWELIWPRLRGAWDPGVWRYPALWIRATRDGVVRLP